jgi:TolA-binding protein
MTSRTTLLTALLALNLVATMPAMAQSSSAFERGVAAYENGDYEAAAEFWMPLAEDGEAEAQRAGL